jgi:hypothetical protein
MSEETKNPDRTSRFDSNYGNRPGELPKAAEKKLEEERDREWNQRYSRRLGKAEYYKEDQLGRELDWIGELEKKYEPPPLRTPDEAEEQITTETGPRMESRTKANPQRSSSRKAPTETRRRTAQERRKERELKKSGRSKKGKNTANGSGIN